MLACLLAAALSFSPADARLARSVASDLVARHTPRDAGTTNALAAAEFICARVRATGASVGLDRFASMTPVGRRDFANVVSTFESASPAPWFVIISHFDTKPGTRCPGANDGAATTGLLVALAGALVRAPVGELNVMLLWTDGEESMRAYGSEDGFWGSRHAAAGLKARNLSVAGVVCLDMLGDRDLAIEIPRNGSPVLAARVLKAAAAAGHAGLVTRSDFAVLDDHVAFLDADYPAVDLIDFHYGSAPGLNDYWHTPADTMDKVSESSLLRVGEIVVRLLDGKSKGR